MTQPAHTENNNLAIASLILGILSLTGMSILTGIPAIITGLMGMKNPVNKSMALAGLIMGCLSTALTVAVVLFFILFLFISAFVGSMYDAGPQNDSGSQPIPDSGQYQQRA